MQEDFASRVRANQEQLSANLGGEFDFTGVRGRNVRFRCCRKTRGESSSEGFAARSQRERRA